MPDDGPRGVSDWFRSDDVEYVSIVMQEHVAYNVISNLGRLGAMQFIDLNSDLTVFQRRYVREVARIDAIENKLDFFENSITKYECQKGSKPHIESFLDRVEQRSELAGNLSRDQQSDLDRLEALVDEKQQELLELNRFQSNLRTDYNAQYERHCILEKAADFSYDSRNIETLDAQGVVQPDQLDAEGDLRVQAVGTGDHMRFQFVAGVCNKETRAKFERQIFRSTRGNCLMTFYDIEEDFSNPISGESEHKEVFIIFFQSPAIHLKITRIAEAFSARLYDIPDLSHTAAIERMSTEVYKDLDQRRLVLEKNLQDILVLLSEVALYIECWKWVCLREKAIYHTLNHFSTDVEGLLHAEGWVRAEKKSEIVQLVNDAHASAQGVGYRGANATFLGQVSDLPPSTWPGVPPTFVKTNRFTSVFQTIVDTYGIPRYQEANPAVMSTITFPFSFGVMFGDIGHGLLLLLFGGWMVVSEKRVARDMVGKDELFDIVFGGRYLIVLMAVFAIYAGFMYNDFFALGLLIWPTHWTQFEDGSFAPNPDVPVYPFGVDPTWHRATNGLVYFNSVKMKMAVIFGITQMMCGLVHRVQNCLYYNSRERRKIWDNVDLWFEALPMLIFMAALFGYMCILILLKWATQWRGWADCPILPPVNDTSASIPAGQSEACTRNNCCNPPSLITQLIGIALSPGGLNSNEEVFGGQSTVQLFLLFIALAMVPMMLIPKPLILIARLKKKKNALLRRVIDSDVNSEDYTENDALNPEKLNEDEEGVGDILVHQFIETIEFVLSSISNTASYLRLWALSLAHSQLSSVFLEKTLLTLLPMSGVLGIIGTFFAYGAFAGISFVVLMCMDQLECFLHALRLAWVEYQNKFYHGDGVAFEPLSFHGILV